jgi:hypothetical protein
LAAKKPVSDKPDKPPKDYSRKTAKAKPLTFKVTASTPAVAEAETLPARTPEKLNASQRKKAAKERAKLAAKMKAKYGPPSTIWYPSPTLSRLYARQIVSVQPTTVLLTARLVATRVVSFQAT